MSFLENNEQRKVKLIHPKLWPHKNENSKIAPRLAMGQVKVRLDLQQLQTY
jgi:hypothetical protein